MFLRNINKLKSIKTNLTKNSIFNIIEKHILIINFDQLVKNILTCTLLLFLMNMKSIIWIVYLL